MKEEKNWKKIAKNFKILCYQNKKNLKMNTKFSLKQWQYFMK